MNPKQEILQVLFDACIFTGNFSELARKLGYANGGRTTIERIKSGSSELSDKKLDKLFEKLYEEYFIGYDDMANIANCVVYGKDLYRQLREAYGTGNDWHDTAFCAVVTENFSALPNFDEELATGLKEMKLQDPDIYYGMLAYFYILCKEIFPYTQKGRKKLDWQLNGLNELLHNTYPGSNRSYESTKKSIEIDFADEELSILKIIYNLRVIIRSYIDDTYFEEFLRETGYLLEVDDDSYWIAPGDTFHEGSDLWYFSVIPTKSHNRGAYIAMRLRAKSQSTDSLEMIEAYNFMFIINKNCNNLHILHAFDLPTGKSEFAEFCFDGDKRLLELNFDNAAEKRFNLPIKLYCINYTKPQKTEDKVWANIIKKNVEHQCRKYLLTAINSSSSSNIEYIDDYDVTNVCIDRKSVTVTIDCGEGKEKNYTIPIENYLFFGQLTPNEFASVVRFKESKELAIVWNDLGQCIPLKEFEEK